MTRELEDGEIVFGMKVSPLDLIYSDDDPSNIEEQFKVLHLHDGDGDGDADAGADADADADAILIRIINSQGCGKGGRGYVPVHSRQRGGGKSGRCSTCLGR